MNSGPLSHRMNAGAGYIPKVSGVSFNCVIRNREIIPLNDDEPLGSEVGIPLVLDHCLHHLPEGLSSGVDSLELLVEGGFWVLMWFRSGFGLIPSFHSGMFLTSFVTVSYMFHK
jgi:hypothetical protein